MSDIGSAHRFVLQQELGQGIATSVYKAWDPGTGRTVAIKVLKKELQDVPRLRRRFLNEARIMARLSHPAILDIYDARVSGDGQLLIVMEYAERGSVGDQMLAGTSWGTQDVMRIGKELASALEYAHAAGVIHRDVQPSNVLFSSRHSARLSDFGAAHLDLPGESQLTITDETLGSSFVYIAPEQRVDARSADYRSDIYSLGATLYNMATGRVPPDLALAERRPDVMSQLDPHLAYIIGRCVAWDPQRRFQSASLLRREFGQAYRKAS